ncbi:hypothetical protein F4861DRAFT_347734 [Xylaria intraflava]|nr:hypothetical protein F4861DRAFT_347734 [Xylaria intraflava]
MRKYRIHDGRQPRYLQAADYLTCSMEVGVSVLLFPHIWPVSVSFDLSLLSISSPLSSLLFFRSIHTHSRLLIARATIRVKSCERVLIVPFLQYCASWLLLEKLNTLTNKVSPRVQPFLRGADKNLWYSAVCGCGFLLGLNFTCISISTSYRHPPRSLSSASTCVRRRWYFRSSTTRTAAARHSCPLFTRGRLSGYCCTWDCITFPVTFFLISCPTEHTLSLQRASEAAEKSVVKANRSEIKNYSLKTKKNQPCRCTVQIRTRLASPHTSRNGAPLLHFTNTTHPPSPSQSASHRPILFIGRHEAIFSIGSWRSPILYPNSAPPPALPPLIISLLRSFFLSQGSGTFSRQLCC